MSCFLLLNFKDFGLNQDITQTIQSQTLVCVCCLDKNVPLINLNTCKHEFYLQSFYKSELESSQKAVCFQCHEFLKKIEHFRQQVTESFKVLEAENFIPANSECIRKTNLKVIKTVNIYLPPARFSQTHAKKQPLKVPTMQPPAQNAPEAQKTLVIEVFAKNSSVKRESSNEPSLAVVKIKAEPEEMETVEAPAVPVDNQEIQQEPEVEKSPGKVVVRTITLSKEELVLERLKQAQSPGYLKYPHRCESCIIGFNYEENIKDHMKRKHGPKVGSVTCDICLAVLYPPGSLNAHLFRHQTRYECVACGERYNSYDECFHHYKKDHFVESEGLKCRKCNYSTDCPLKLKQHKLQHKRYSCRDCGVVLATQQSLTRHMSVIHNKRVYKCAHCKATRNCERTFIAHMRSHGAAAARAACEPCGTQFKTWQSYNAHILFSTAHQNSRKKYSCKDCGMKFATPTHLRMHVDFSSHPKRSFKCPDCPKEFTVEAELKQHRNVHQHNSQSSDSICDYCGRVYTSREHLIHHIEIHMRKQKLQKAKEARAK